MISSMGVVFGIFARLKFTSIRSLLDMRMLMASWLVAIIIQVCLQASCLTGQEPILTMV